MKATRVYTAIILFALTVTLSAQKQEKQTVVLNGGSRLTGTILVDSADYLKMRISSPQVIKLKKSEVLLTTPAQNIEHPLTDRHGYSICLSASVLTGHNSEGNTRSLSFHLSNGYQFRNGMSVGFGTGFEELDVALLPVYTDIRYHLFKSRLSPFLWTKCGWSFAFDEKDDGQYYYHYYGNYSELKGGFMFNAGTGIELASWRRNAVNIGIGYRYQKIIFKRVDNWGEEITNELVTSYNRIEVQFGFIFR
jgi:hypothetical protein